VKPAGIPQIKRGNIRKKLMGLQLVKTRTAKICIEEKMNLRAVTNLEVT
jgi:hypothetical protein